MTAGRSCLPRRWTTETEYCSSLRHRGKKTIKMETNSNRFGYARRYMATSTGLLTAAVVGVIATILATTLSFATPITYISSPPV